MRWGTWALAACLALPAHAGVFTLRIVAQESVPPKWLPRAGRVEGFCPDVLAAITRLEPRLQFTGMNETRSVPHIEQGLESGWIGAACGLLDTARRRAIAYQSVRLFSIRQRIVAAAGDTADVQSIEDIAHLGALVNTPRGAAYAEQLRAAGIRVDDSTGDNLVNLKKVLAGHGRFTYMNELTLNWLVRSEHLDAKLKILPAVLDEEPIYFWISRKTDPVIVRLAEQALDKLAASGELARIYDHWVNAKP
ncbi:MAG: substrate-binding periplasmic protein [Telluria sp.]